MSAGSFPDVVAYPEQGYAWVATRDPDPELLAKGGDPGIIAGSRFRSSRPGFAPVEMEGRSPGWGAAPFSLGGATCGAE